MTHKHSTKRHDSHEHERSAQGGHDERAGEHAHHHEPGHGKHAGHSVEMFRDKFWISLALTVPAVVWSEMIQEWFGYAAPTFPGSLFIPAVFGTIVYFLRRMGVFAGRLARAD